MNTISLTITPEQARKWIDDAPINPRYPSRRSKVDYQHAAQFVDAMRNGTFYEMPNGIILDENGILVDGFHRLHAITVVGKSVTMRVTTGVKESVKPLIDWGVKARSNGAMLGSSTSEADIVGVLQEYVFCRARDMRLMAMILKSIQPHTGAVFNAVCGGIKLYSAAAMRTSVVLAVMSGITDAIQLYKAIALVRPEDHPKAPMGLRCFKDVPALDRRQVLVRAWKLFTCKPDAQVIRYAGTQEELNAFRAYARESLNLMDVNLSQMS
jgi:hypothetical protein